MGSDAGAVLWSPDVPGRPGGCASDRPRERGGSRSAGILQTAHRAADLPVAWPFTRFPSFESGAAGLGINIEAVRYAPGRPSPVREDAGIYAIACVPAPLSEARSELAQRDIPHSPPLRFTGRYPTDANTPVFHQHPDGLHELWTLVFLGGMIGDESSAGRYSRGLERGDTRLAPLIGRIGGDRQRALRLAVFSATHQQAAVRLPLRVPRLQRPRRARERPG